MRIPVWFVAAVVVVVSLLTGVVVGIAVDRRVLVHRPIMVSRGGRWHGPMVPGRLERELGLTPSQSAAVDSVMGHRMAQRDSLMAHTFPMMRALLDSTRTDIERVLTPDQRAKFETMRFHDGLPPGRGAGGGDRDQHERDQPVPP